VREATDRCIREMSWEELREKGVARAVMPSPHVPFADMRFNTPSGRIELYTEQLAPHGQGVPTFEEPLEGNRREKARRYPLTFMTNHSMYSANATHMGLPWIRELVPEPRVEMNPADANARGLADGDGIRIFNERGSFRAHVHVTEGIKPGALNLAQGWWPEHFSEGHYADLTQMPLNPAQETILESNYPVYDCLVEVERAATEAV
ncbi:MAG: molybdopterin dinucleotide binding domain-containing protein, partial [Gammaproteobacteria bacterium]